MIVGCPGSGKSTLSKMLGKELDIPVLHLDYIYDIDSFKRVSKQELKDMVEIFVLNNPSFVLDGNYHGTLEWRLQFCDLVIVMDFDTDICIRNMISRMDDNSHSEEGLDITMEEEFISYIEGFRDNKLVSIMDKIKASNTPYVVLRNESQVNAYVEDLRRQSK
jgi:adenylate kinase family enzyme